MKKFVFTAIAIIAVFSVALYIDAQPAGGGGMGGGMGFGAGGGGGMMGGGGGRGARGLRARPEKAARLTAVKELEKQVAALKAAVEKAPATDPNLVTIKDTDLTKFMDTYTVESNAINTIQATLASLSGTGARGGMGRNTGAPTEEILTELSTLAKDEKATKTAARIAALIEQAQQRATRGAGGGMMGGGAGAGGGMGRGGRGGAQQ
ncbi:MAG: hypothetical protein JXA96_11730 [Sedimentisphaerales bacterium]|nr:hypothetical protein [Sedimentisphaerales bacterium]